MSTLAELRAALKAVIVRIGDTAHVQWRDGAQEQSTGTKVLLQVRSFVTVGTPEERQRNVHEDPDDEESPVVGIAVDVIAQKTFTLVVLVECHNQAITANELGEKIRDRLFRPFSLDTLRAADCAIRSVGPASDVSRVIDKRWVSIVSFDVLCNWSSADTQEAFDDTGDSDAPTWIDTVILNQGIENEQVIDLTEAP